MNDSSRMVAWLAGSIFLAAALACGEPRCPRGYIKKGDTCYRVKDAGTEANETEPAEAGPDTSSDPDAGSGDAESDAAKSEDPDDKCDHVPCEHGGRCSTVEHDFSCNCEGTGYEGPTCAIDRDECAMLNSCTSSVYPCVQTAPPGYACRGQFADWPMPDALPGARFAPAYDTSTAGVVVDQVTGLVWQRGLGDDSEGYSWIAANLYCDALNLGGNDDWRLPTKIELESIIDETQRPAIDRFAFDDDGTIVWTASPVVGEPDFVWLIDFINGSSAFFIRTSESETSRLDVKCVRGPADAFWREASSSRYVVDAASDTVTDDRTGLLWQKTLSTGNHTWEGAKNYCAGLGTGWRVPAYKELLTLVDPTRRNPSIDPQFSNTPSVLFWTASPTVLTDGSLGSPRRVHFADGAFDGSDATASRVRCVK